MNIAANAIAAATALMLGVTIESHTGHEEAAEWLKLVDRFGAMAVILFYMLLKDWITWRANAKRYYQLEKRLDDKDVFIQTKLVAALERSTTALEKANLTSSESSDLLKSMKMLIDLPPQEASSVHTSAVVRSPETVREARNCKITGCPFGQSEHRQTAE